jgi:hypothetical protein
MLNDIQQCREALGYVDSPTAIESTHNKSGQRTPEKGELLRRASTRQAGWKPVFPIQTVMEEGVSA